MRRRGLTRSGWRIVVIALVVLAPFVAWLAFPARVTWAFERIAGSMGFPTATIRDRLDEHADRVRERCEARYASAGVAWPPRRLRLVAFKRERRLDVFATDSAGSWRLVGTHPVLAASGGPGPKLVAGDRQVPEGLYAIASLNPNSRFHLALRVDYPNADDRDRAREDGRTDLGGDIMIHGGASSVGCLAMGDDVIEELFVAAALAGIENVSVVLAPCDLRTCVDAEVPPEAPSWTRARWAEIRTALDELPTR